MLRNYPFSANLIALGASLAAGSAVYNAVNNFLTK